MNTQILKALRAAGDGYISGQELCDRLQVSRTAVWKRVTQLREEGYEIEAVPNRGYRILASPDTLTAQEVGSRMRTEWAGRGIQYFERIDSTNRAAKQLGEEGAAEGTLVIAEEQTAGRGRVGRSWVTPPRSAIAMSLLLRPALPPERISMVTLVMGMAVAGACRALVTQEAGEENAEKILIKWPNDVVWDGKKISGTLTEMSAEMMAVNYIVIGTGINVNIPAFPEELAGQAASLLTALGHPVCRAQLAADVLYYFEQEYRQFLLTQDMSLLRERYNAMLVNTGRQVRVMDPGGEYTGTALGISDAGELLVKREDGPVTAVSAGEVSVRGLYGYV